ncbi:hypothetical protein G7Y89_g13335 [Cudoniella acicularis]|uniref:Uncharacterized protein n=1 Tax=Cudoniella acicularis TaxID=354080 RepID=A0A8H4R7H2_9HELO|nr:hypothetical protein G7Y89_g13335 [Cudoniella acicularis]
MSYIPSFLQSNGGSHIPPEVCLKIAEALLESDPKSVTAMTSLSKSFYTLLKSYERSVTKSVSDDSRFAYTNASQPSILASRAPPNTAQISTLTYKWYQEMKDRRSLIEFLITHEITAMQDSSNGWPCLDLSIGEAFKLEQEFKRRGLHLLFRLADCTTGLSETKDIRMKQAQYLDSLKVNELATLGCIVEVIGQGFFTITKAALLDQLPSSRLSSNSKSTLTLAVPPQIPWHDLQTDNWIRECMCVFEDRLQRFGPYFAWAYVTGYRDRKRRPDLWASSELQEGLDNMNAYELGYTMSPTKVKLLRFRHPTLSAPAMSFSKHWSSGSGLWHRVLLEKVRKSRQSVSRFGKSPQTTLKGQS